MYIYALVTEAYENNLGDVLQHPERKSIGALSEIWKDLREEKRHCEDRPPDSFSEWLVKEHGFAFARTVVFNTDTENEWELLNH